MSWGAFNICSEDHATAHNVEVAAGAKYAVRYPHKFGAKGIRFWATTKGAALDIGRCGRSWGVTSWLYARDESPTPVVTYEKGASNPSGVQAIHIAKLAGYDVSSDGPYFATFYNQCDRLYIAQNLAHDGSSVRRNYSKELILQPAIIGATNVFSDPPNDCRQRPFMAPTMPADYVYSQINWPNLGTKRGLKPWVNNGWAYKKVHDRLNGRNRHEFDWREESDPEWGNDSIWDVTPNPAAGLDRTLLYLVEKRYSHGPNHTCETGTNPRLCDDRLLTGYRAHYWVKTAPAPQQWSQDALLKSWCADDGYPYVNAGHYYYKNGWAPYSISCGQKGVFARTRTLDSHKGHADEPYYAKTDLHADATGASASKAGYTALKEFIPEKTAFDVVCYLEVIYYAIYSRTRAGSPPYYTKVDSGYWNTKCHAIIHQIAPLPPKPV